MKDSILKARATRRHHHQFAPAAFVEEICSHILILKNGA
jgi:hypothetical protein